MKIVSLTTCNNRSDKTLLALESLHNQILPSNVEMQNIIVDDGSTDQTSDLVHNKFPDVIILKGNGNLYWAGGMIFGWKEYVRGLDFNFLFLYNDDIYLKADALSRLISTSISFQDDGGCKEHVVVGSFHDGAKSPITTYGGLLRSSKWHPLRFSIIDPPKKKYAFVDTLNMNSCLVKRELIGKIGFFSEYFIHSGADFEFGIRTIKAGGKILLANGYLGECKRNYQHDNFIKSSRSLIECYNTFIGAKQQPLTQRFKYFKNHGGLLWFIFFVTPYLSLPIKYIWKKYIRR